MITALIVVFGALAFGVLLLMYLDGYWTHEAAIRRIQRRAYNRLLNGTPRAYDVDAAREIIRKYK